MNVAELTAKYNEAVAAHNRALKTKSADSVAFWKGELARIKALIQKAQRAEEAEAIAMLLPLADHFAGLKAQLAERRLQREIDAEARANRF